MEEERILQPDTPDLIPDDVQIIAPDTAIEPVRERPFALSVTVGLIAALGLGAIWAGISIATDYEIGIIAWVIGLGVSAAMVATAGQRSTRLGIAAVLLSLLGLATGKVMTSEIGLVSGVADEILAEPEWQEGLTYQALLAEGKVDPEVQAWWETSEPGDAPPEALAERVAAFEDDIQKRLAAASDEEKRAWAEPFARLVIEEASPMDRYNLGFYDLVWVALAIAAAWGVAGSRQEQMA